MVRYYKSLAELVPSSELIVEGEVTDSNVIVHYGTPFTISDFKIKNVLKGNKQADDGIKVIETGGIYICHDADPKMKNMVGKQLEERFAGIPALKVGEKLYLFLKKFQGPQIKGECYISVGEYQSKYRIDKNNKVYFRKLDYIKPKNSNNNNDISEDFTKKFTKDEFVQKINSLK
jgi:hypothetical protein